MKTIAHLLALLAPLLLSLPTHAGDFSQRDDVQAFIHDLAQRQNFNADELQAAFNDAQELPKVIELIRPPTNPGVRSWQRYRPRFINNQRISAGVQFWRDNADALAAAEAQTGVPAEIIVGIIGVETVYGRNMGNFSTLSALTTLAFDYPPRAPLFRRELEALFLLAREQGRDVRDYRGSYAGALGQPQFLPSSIRNFAVDGDQDGRIDLRDNATDAIFSVGNYLAIHGWQRGGRIVLPAQVEDEAQARLLVDAGILPAVNGQMLRQAGVRSDLPEQSPELVTLVDMVSPGFPTEYWLGFQNFYVITRYNHSSFYAMSVHDLGRAVKLEFDARRDLAQLNQAPKRRVSSARPRR
ncbi:MAG: mltB [Proteobacteria bacterium]|nr:mltB [Pseudomonadota bacterium]